MESKIRAENKLIVSELRERKYTTYTAFLDNGYEPKGRVIIEMYDDIPEITPERFKNIVELLINQIQK